LRKKRGDSDLLWTPDRSPAMSPPWKRFQLRNWANLQTYIKIELQLLKKEWVVILPCVIMQCACLPRCSGV
jgi:hypothetical protein